jgi:REP element-mobilizing transposase RayT
MTNDTITTSEPIALQKRHARFHAPGVPYHIISKTMRGEFSLTPHQNIAEICAGVVAKAEENWPEIDLQAYAFMSNHMHLIVSAESNQISKFVGFIKREISRRVGKKINMPGSLWGPRFVSTALPTPASQVECLRYILSHGTKEDLVAHPRDWPGLHCAEALLTGKPDIGSWFDATAYARARWAKRQNPELPTVNKGDYYRFLPINLKSLTCWKHLSSDERSTKIATMIEEIVKECSEKRRKAGKNVLGKKKILRCSIRKRSTPPKPPWWQERKRQLVAWAKATDELTKQYVALYWEFQQAFREAAQELLLRPIGSFPPGAWAPAQYQT